MRKKRYELIFLLWNMLSMEEMERGEVSVAYAPGIRTDITTGSSMIDQLMLKSPYADHIIGFKRNPVFGIDLILDAEGQEQWDKDYQAISDFYKV